MTRAEAQVEPARVANAADVAVAAQLACLLEASAPKPGNVSPCRHFADTRYEDFLASAAAVGQPLAGAGTRGVGATVRLAIEATRRWTDCNTNLGIVLLLAPLARAALRDDARGTHSSSPEPRAMHPQTLFASPESGLRLALRQVLDATTVEDARDVYAAIRLASPGGLGQADRQDVAHDPDVTLLEAMRLAAHRDGIAREYATTFAVTFDTAAPMLRRARLDGLPWDEAIVETFLGVLATNPDTHITRRAGEAVANEVSARARTVLDEGGVRTEAGRRAIEEMDRDLRDPRHVRNPGTTADLTTAAIFVELLRGNWR